MFYCQDDKLGGITMTDTIIEAINNSQLSRENISFDKLRHIAGRDNNIWHSLGSGRAILSTNEQLDQYLYSYGPMTKAQWEILLSKASLPNGNLHLVDYGCGQGLGSVMLFDYFGSQLTSRIKQIKLIEPSAIALYRAKAVVDCYLAGPRANIINKMLDDVTTEEIHMNGSIPVVHLLSNVLDIEGFNHGNLFSKILGNIGRHTVLAVSHDRNFEGGSYRFEQLDRAIKDPKYSGRFKIESSTIQRYTCGSNKPAISWELRIEVLNGSL